MYKKREEDKAHLAATVIFCISMWRSSGEIDYLHKAIANIRAAIEKEEGKKNETVRD